MLRTTRRAIALAAILCGPAVAAAQQPIDSAYTAKIKEYLQDPRITTELVDHLPASATVPTPLKFHGRIVGTPGELTYAKDIHRYFDALDKASDRAVLLNMGKTEEGRDMVVLIISDEATIRDLETYKRNMNALTDPRRTSEAEARRLIQQTKPMYWVTTGMHSTETGGPETVQELAYRLIVQESPFVQNIRNNVIVAITPVIEVDGREKMVDTYYFNKKRDTSDTRLPLMYWGKYVAHDNNRDHIGQFLALSKNVTKHFLEWHPIIMHDLHERGSYLYVSTGTGPYNEAIDAITVDEWWMLAKSDVNEMTKRGVPGVWTYGFYDGWTPNYMFFAAHAHNAIGRFYEVERYGPDNDSTVTVGASTSSREWFRPNPPLPTIKWGPRNHVHMSQSGVLFSLSHVAKNREMYMENYWIKNKRAIARKDDGTAAWHIPAGQRRKGEVAAVVNDLRFQGLEFHRATSDFTVGSTQVKAGDYIVRGDQPYRTIGDMYFSLQSFSPANPRPYDDTGWTYQLMRNIVLTPVSDTAILSKPMQMVTADVRAPGGIEGNGSTIVVANVSDNNLATFRFRFARTRMLAAESDFEAGGKQFSAGSFIIPNGNRGQLEPVLRELGLSAVAVSGMPQVKTHELDVPRIGYVHAWQRTQDEGWVRAALDTYGIPYTYFADQKLREGDLREKYDVIIYPHVGGNVQSMVNGIAKNPGDAPLPYRKTSETPNLGAQDQSDDIRGGMGVEGLFELYRFVQQGGTLITEGSTAMIFPEYNFTPGVSVVDTDELFARGSIMRARIADTTSPIVYGYEGNQMPVYFNQAPVLNVAGSGGGFGGFGGGGNSETQNITPMSPSNRPRLSPWDGPVSGSPQPRGRRGAGADRSERAGGGGGGGGGGRPVDATRPRVVLQFPSNPADILLSGTLAGGEELANRAQVVDSPVGEGHVVMFAIRPFWRWQTHGTYMLGFNAIMNWNDLDAGRTSGAATTANDGNGPGGSK